MKTFINIFGGGRTRYQTFRVLTSLSCLIALISINASSRTAEARDQGKSAIAFATDDGVFVMSVNEAENMKTKVASYFDPEVDPGLRYLPQPKWSPDGTKLTFRYHKLHVMKELPSWWPRGLSAIGSQGYVAIVNSDGSELRMLSPGKISSWSPDGKSLIFVGYDNATSSDRLAVMPSDGHGEPNLFGPSLFNPGLAIWSPDGKEILFEWGDNLHLVNLDGTNLRRVVKGEFPAYSPDGKHVLFSSKLEGKTSIYIMDSEGKNQKKLIADIGNNSQPSWAPDGSRFVFWSDRHGKGALYIANSDGSQIVPLQGTNGAWYPSWSPFLKK